MGDGRMDGIMNNKRDLTPSIFHGLSMAAIVAE
jgi:hypothetical protein